MVHNKFHVVGRGIYSLVEAERLINVPRQRIHRWTRGHTYRYKGGTRYSPPIIATEVKAIKGSPALDFSDLIEARFLNAFREHEVGFKAIRIASQRARELLGRHRPFSTKIFKTDGRTILAEIVKETGDKVLLDLVRSQYAFEQIMSPFLYTGIEFNDYEEAERWWPLGLERSIVLDPNRAFGAPIVSKGGVPTRILYNAVNIEQSIDFVAAWYEIEKQEVHDAITYEKRLAA